MNIKINFLENIIKIDKDRINNLEINNKSYFYRIVNELYKVSKGLDSEDVEIISSEKKKTNINMILNLFDFELYTKKYLNEIIKYILFNTPEITQEKINKKYNNFVLEILKLISEYDLPLSVNEEMNFQDILKNVKFSINNKKTVLENLFLIIDLESILKINDLLIFVNLKQYLNEADINELYKYAIYNDVKLTLIDNQLYKDKNEFENKIIIDSDLNEFVI